MKPRSPTRLPNRADLLALVKPGIVESNVFTALGGMALAPWRQSASLAELGLRFALLALGTAALVGGACAVNNWLDRDIDALMTRTKERPTAAGRMGPAWALGVGGTLLALGLGLLALLGPVPPLIGALGAFVYVFPYTLWTKRRSVSSSLVGGIAGAVPPLIGWSVEDPALGHPALLLLLFLVIWQQAHVRALALRRASDFDRASVPMPGLETGRTGEPRAAGPEGVLAPGARWGLIAWIIVLLPFPYLLSAALPPSTALPFAIGETAVLAAWALLALGASHPAWSRGLRVWGSRMFFSSLLVLVLFFAGLLGAKFLSLALGPLTA